MSATYNATLTDSMWNWCKASPNPQECWQNSLPQRDGAYGLMQLVQLLVDQMGILVNPHTFTLIAIFAAFLIPTAVFNNLIAQASQATYNFWDLRDTQNSYLIAQPLFDQLVNLIPMALIELFVFIIYGISVQFFVMLLNVYFPLYPTGADDTYTMGSAMTLFCISFMWISTMYILGGQIAVRYDLWSQAVQNFVFSAGSEAIYQGAGVFNTSNLSVSWIGSIMWYLQVYVRPIVLILYMIACFSIPVVSIEVLAYLLILVPWVQVW